MKKLSFIMVAAVMLAVVLQGTISAPALAQSVSVEAKSYTYPAPPQKPAEHPWVGPNTPWTYYNNDWFYKGTLYYDYGERGWAPYYSYETTTVTRPSDYYDTKWSVWYQKNPTYTETLIREHPYWKEHHVGTVYNENFYITHDKREGENRWRRAWHELKHEDRD